MLASTCVRRTASRTPRRPLITTIRTPRQTRPLTTSKLDPAIRGFVHKLAQHQPCFPMASSKIHILREPRQFYQTLLVSLPLVLRFISVDGLLDMFRRARRRIFISSLYLGSEEVELVEVLRHSLRENPSLILRMHLDLNRSTRPGPDSPAHTLLPLLNEFPDRVRISLFRSPKLKGVLAKLVPPRFNEGWGTWHPKIYGVDDEVLISGANLNESYFSNRQDRYIHLTSQPFFAEYCFAFLQSSAGFSYQLLPWADSSNEYQLQWGDPKVHPHNIERKARESLLRFQNSFRLSTPHQISPTPPTSDPALPNENSSSANDAANDTLIFPIIQAGQFGIREEENALSYLFDSLSDHMHLHSKPVRMISSSTGDMEERYAGPMMDLTTGYFGLYRPYRDLVLQSGIACRVIASSPKANGFYGSKGISGYIPEGYTLLERRFMRAVRKAGRAYDKTDKTKPGVDLREWEKYRWTYHAKGIWLRPTPLSHPNLTLFGSTNLNSRSSNLDTELSFMMVTTSPLLRKRLGEEVEGLREDSGAWRGGERSVRIGTRILVGLVGNML